MIATNDNDPHGFSVLYTYDIIHVSLFSPFTDMFNRYTPVYLAAL